MFLREKIGHRRAIASDQWVTRRIARGAPGECTVREAIIDRRGRRPHFAGVGRGPPAAPRQDFIATR